MFAKIRAQEVPAALHCGNNTEGALVFAIVNDTTSPPNAPQAKPLVV